MTSTIDLNPILAPITLITTTTTTTTNSPNSNDSSHNLSLSSLSSNSNGSGISNLSKVLETQPKSTDSGIGSEKSCTPDYLSNKKSPSSKNTTPAAKKQHNDIEKKRKDLISVGIRKLNEILPNFDAKEVKNKILEKACIYIKELQENNKRLIISNVPEQHAKEIQNLYQRIQDLERINLNYLNLLQSAGINPTIQTISTELWNSKPTKYSNKLSPQDVVLNRQPENNNATNNSKKKNTKKSNNKTNNQSSVNKPTTNLPATNPLIVSMSDPNQIQLLGGNQDNLLNNQLQLCSQATNYQMLPNGQLCPTDPMTNTTATGNLMPGQIIISQPFINQPTSAILLPNGQLVPVMQNQPNLIYHPNQGIMLTNSAPVNTAGQQSTGQATGQQPQQQPTINKMNSTSFTVNSSIITNTSAMKSSVITTNSTPSVTINNSLTQSATLPQSALSVSLSNSQQQTGAKSTKGKNNKSQNSTKQKKCNVTKAEKSVKTTKASKKSTKKNESKLVVPANKPNNDILAKAFESIIDFSKSDEMGDLMDDFDQPIQTQQIATTNEIPTPLESINNNNSANSGVHNSNQHASDQSPLIQQQSVNNSITTNNGKSTNEDGPLKKKKKLNDKHGEPNLTGQTVLDDNQTELNLNHEDTDQTNDIDKLLNSNPNVEDHAHNQMDFEFHDPADSEISKNDNDAGLPLMLNETNQTNENSFLTNLNGSEHLNDFLAINNTQTHDDRQQAEKRNLNDSKTVNDLFESQISHSITEKDDKNKKSSLDAIADQFKSPLDLLNQDADKTTQPTQTSTPTSSYLSYSAESLVTKQVTTSSNTSQDYLLEDSNFLLSSNSKNSLVNNQASSKNSLSRTSITYSAESLIHPSSSTSRDDLIISNLSPVTSHHSDSRPSSNSSTIQHPNQLNRSLNSSENAVSANFPIYVHTTSSEERNNTSLFPTSATSTSTNQQSHHSQPQNKHSSPSFNRPFSNNSTMTNSEFDPLNPFFATSTSSATNYQSNTSTLSASILPFNYKDPLNNNQSTSSFSSSNQNRNSTFKSTPSSLFSNASVFQESYAGNQIVDTTRKSTQKRNSPNLTSKNTPAANNKKSNSNKSTQQLNQPIIQQLGQQSTYNDYNGSIGIQNHQVLGQSNRQSQFYLDASNNSSLSTTNSSSLSNPLSVNNYLNNFSMTDFNSTSNQVNNSSKATSSSAFATNQSANDNFFLRPQSTVATNQSNLNPSTTNRPNFNLSNIIPDISSSKLGNNYIATGYFNDQSNNTLFNPQNPLSSSTFNNIQHHSLNHLPSNLHNTTSSSNLNRYNSRPIQASSAQNTLHTSDTTLYRPFGSGQFNLSAADLNNHQNSMNSLSMPTIGSNSGLTSLNSQSNSNNNNTLIPSQSTNQNPFESFAYGSAFI